MNSDSRISTHSWRVTHTNRAPNAVVLPSGEVECNAPRSAQVLLDGHMSTDPDNNIRDYFWFVNDEPIETIGPLVPTSLPFGSSTIKLELTDTRLSFDTAVSTVTVVDTTPPQFTAASITPSCIWPPTHEYVRFELGTEILASVTDVCDPSSTVRVRRVISNEPDNGIGDGNTTHDVIFGNNGFCVRAERSNRGTGRTYAVELESVDASGNVTTHDIDVVVPRDQRGCPSLSKATFLSDAEAAAQCVFEAP